MARRIYAICYSNAGSAYIRVGSERLFINGEAETTIERLEAI